MIYRPESACAEIRRGRVYWVFADGNKGCGSEQASGRLALVVSNDKCNIHSPVIEICYLTTKQKKPLPTHVFLNACGGESKARNSTVLCEQICSVDVMRIGDYYGELSEEEMKDVNRALAVSIGLPKDGRM